MGSLKERAEAMSKPKLLKTCPDCGYEYDESKDAVEVYYENQLIKSCPRCGCTNIKR